jgi:hypothetical protein
VTGHSKNTLANHNFRHSMSTNDAITGQFHNKNEESKKNGGANKESKG